MKALVLLSHGSRRRESNAEMEALARAVAAVEGHSFAQVMCAFQQFATPDFNQAVDQLVAQGVTHIVVFPLFLAAGSHVQEDVPAMIAAARKQNFGIEFIVTPHLGQISDMAAFLVGQAGRYVCSDSH